MLLNNQWITEETKEEIKKHQETNENENTMIQNLNNQWITEEIKEEIKNTKRQMKMKTQWSKTYGMQQKQF